MAKKKKQMKRKKEISHAQLDLIEEANQYERNLLASWRLADLRIPKVWDLISNLINYYEQKPGAKAKAIVERLQHKMEESFFDRKAKTADQLLYRSALAISTLKLRSERYKAVAERYGLTPKDLASITFLNILTRPTPTDPDDPKMASKVQGALLDFLRSQSSEFERRSKAGAKKGKTAAVEVEPTVKWKVSKKLTEQYRAKMGEGKLTPSQLKKHREKVAKIASKPVKPKAKTKKLVVSDK